MKSIAVIGLGNIAKRHRRNLRIRFPGAQVICLSASGREVEGAVTDADLLVSSVGSLITLRPDMVIVASPASFHSLHTIPLLEAGIPVLIEKPVTSTGHEAKALLATSEHLDTAVNVGYCLRYLPSTNVVKELLKKRTIGAVYNAWVDVGQYLPDWRPDTDYKKSVSANAQLGGGALLELSHELDYLSYVLNDNLSFCSAILRNSSELNLNVEELADFTLSSSRGVVCHLHMDFIQKPPRRFCSFMGSEGRIEWDLVLNSVTVTRRGETYIEYSEPSWDKNGMYLAMLNCEGVCRDSFTN
jgi:predicted dehydrogenase